MKKRVRNNFIDFVKAIAIICVVFGHCIQYGSGGAILYKAAFFDNPVFTFIYSFHMPLFMLVSGYLFAYSANRRSIVGNVKNKFMTLVLPIFVWVSVSCFITIVIDYLNNCDIHPFGVFRTYIYDLFLSFWFLWSIFWSSMVVLLIRQFLKDSWIAYLFVVIISLFIPNMYNIQMYSFMFPYYVLGYKYNNYLVSHNCIKSSLERYKTKILVWASILFGALLFLYNYNAYIYTSGYCILKGNVLYQLFIDFYRFCIGLIGGIFFILLLDKVYSIVQEGNIRKLLLYIGQQTMGIYIIHIYIVSLVLVKFTKKLHCINYGITVLESIVMIASCLLCIMILKKNRFTNRLFLGGK